MDRCESSAPPKKRYKVSFQPEYSVQYPCLVRGKDPSFARCKICDCEFKIDHGGLNDCKKHVNSKKHISKHQVVNAVNPITSFMKSEKSSSLDQAVTKAELLFTSFLVEHNIQLSASDHASKLFKEMFVVQGVSSKDIIEKFTCGRTKTTALVNELALDDRASLVRLCQENAFSISTDGSNDNTDKLYPLVITYVKDFEVKIDLLSLLELKAKGTGQNIADLIHDELSSLNIPWTNCLSLCTDNANSMIGTKTGLYGCLLKFQSNLFSTGCACHRIHLAAEWAAKELPVNPDSFFVDLYYYLEKSANRLQDFKGYQTECETDCHKVPKHVPTRWLSLGKVTKWVIKQWEPLTLFFKRECDLEKEVKKTLKGDELKNDRKKRVLENLESRVTKLTLHFLNFIIPKFEALNLKLQADEPLVHKQRRMTLELIKELMVMFIKPCAMVFKEVSDVDLTSSYNFKPVEEIQIGSEAKDYIKDSKLPEEKVVKFYQCVQKFLLISVKYLLKNMKLDDTLYLKAEVADISLQQNTSFKKLEYFTSRFPVLIPHGFTIDDLQSEFNHYQVEDLPPSVTRSPRADLQWKAISDITSVTGDKKYKVLPQVMLAILSIPHSNACSERIFSMVRKNRTDFRGRMSVGTLQSLMVRKQKGGVCFQQQFPKELLKRCSSATSRFVTGNQQ